MVPILLALLSCVSFGVSDFLQGLASRRAASGPIMLVSQSVGLAIMAIAAIAFGGLMTRQDYIWGAVSGALLLLGTALLIFAFRHGRISIAAPVLGAVGMAVPPIYSLAKGNDLGTFTWSGLILGVIAIVLLSHKDRNGFTVAILPLIAAIGAGLALGSFAVVLKFTSSGSGLWPLVVGYAVRFSLLCLSLFFIGRLGASVREVRRDIIPVTSAAGIIVSLASAFYLTSLQQGGNLVVMNTIASEAPAVTVLLAMIVSHEILHKTQVWGLGATALSLLLIGLG